MSTKMHGFETGRRLTMAANPSELAKPGKTSPFAGANLD